MNFQLPLLLVADSPTAYINNTLIGPYALGHATLNIPIYLNISPNIWMVMRGEITVVYTDRVVIKDKNNPPIETMLDVPGVS